MAGAENAVSAPSSWKSSAGEALSGYSAQKQKKAEPSHQTRALYNKFAKFTAISDAEPLWKQAAQQLAQYAVQVQLNAQSIETAVPPFLNHYKQTSSIGLVKVTYISVLSLDVSQVTAEGGQDAAMEAPFIYAAIDALVSRAMAWAERRQRMLLEAHPEDASLYSPEEAATAASATVKEVNVFLLTKRIACSCLLKTSRTKRILRALG